MDIQAINLMLKVGAVVCVIGGVTIGVVSTGIGLWVRSKF